MYLCILPFENLIFMYIFMQLWEGMNKKTLTIYWTLFIFILNFAVLRPPTYRIIHTLSLLIIIPVILMNKDMMIGLQYGREGGEQTSSRLTLLGTQHKQNKQTQGKNEEK